MPSSASARLPWIDHLRTFAIFLVVVTHSCVTYSHVGSWYVMSEHEPSLYGKLPFIVVEGMNQSFFMGLLFFLAAYFAHGSLARRGAGSFVRERLFRLGMPTLLFMLAIHPFILLGLNPWHTHFPPVATFYAHYLRTGEFVGSSGPLWFAFALLIFCLVLAAWRSVVPVPTDAALALAAPPAPRAIWLFAALLGLATFLVRQVQPLGTSVLNMQLAYFPQYLAAFALGLDAARRKWLVPLAATPHARRAGLVALIAGPISLLVLLIVGVRGGPHIFDGGLHWQAFGLALWEQLTGIGLSLGLLSLFSRRLNVETPPLRWLADRSFGVYVLHTPLLVALYMLFRTLPQAPLALAALMIVSGWLGSYLLADLAKRLPGLRSIL